MVVEDRQVGGEGLASDAEVHRQVGSHGVAHHLEEQSGLEAPGAVLRDVVRPERLVCGVRASGAAGDAADSATNADEDDAAATECEAGWAQTAADGGSVPDIQALRCQFSAFRVKPPAFWLAVLRPDLISDVATLPVKSVNCARACAARAGRNKDQNVSLEVDGPTN